jgi:hypothetical protein
VRVSRRLTPPAAERAVQNLLATFPATDEQPLPAPASRAFVLERSPLPRRLRFEELQQLCGVYFLFKEGRLQYVGRSTHVFVRLRTHRRQGRTPFDDCRVEPCAPDQLNTLEAAYIRQLAPPFNRSRQSKISGRESWFDRPPVRWD